MSKENGENTNKFRGEEKTKSNVSQPTKLVGGKNESNGNTWKLLKPSIEANNVKQMGPNSITPPSSNPSTAAGQNVCSTRKGAPPNLITAKVKFPKSLWGESTQPTPKPKKKGSIMGRMLKFGVKSAIVGSIFYYTAHEGLWGSYDDTKVFLDNLVIIPANAFATIFNNNNKKE